jgi:hypothetical protein
MDKVEVDAKDTLPLEKRELYKQRG